MTTEFDAELVTFANEVGPSDPVAVRGGGTRWGLGGAVDPGTRELRAPVGIVDHRPDEMTVRVRAGTEVTVLHRELERANQRTALPVRPAVPPAWAARRVPSTR